MWIVVCFDLPTKTKKEKRNYLRFKKLLEGDGYSMMQFSMYTKHVPSSEVAERYTKNISKSIPDNGHVRIFVFTDKQYGSHKVYFGKRRVQEETAAQLSLLI